MGQSHTLSSYCPSFFLNFPISSITLLSTSNLACPPRTSTPAAASRSSRHTADNRRYPARSCCPSPQGTASYRVGYPGAKTTGGNSLSRTFSTTWIALAQAPILQAAQESLLWSFPAKEALSTQRPLV